MNFKRVICLSLQRIIFLLERNEEGSMKTIIKLLFAPSILIFCSLAYATPGGLLWEDYYDREGNELDQAHAIAAKGNNVFVAGRTSTLAGGYAFTVGALSAKDGSLVWADYYDREGDGDDWANAIAVKGNTVFVAGMTSTLAGGYAFTVRAYSATDGSLLWADYYDREGKGYDAANAIAVKGNTVFVAGITSTLVGYTAFTVGALFAKDGSLLWADYYDREGNGYDVANAIAVKGKSVFVAGTTGTSAGGEAFTVRAYSAKDGKLLLDNFYDREGKEPDEANTIAVLGNSVFVAGTTTTSAGSYAFTVRAYSTK
jgi:TolB-like protein